MTMDFLYFFNFIIPLKANTIHFSLMKKILQYSIYIARNFQKETRKNKVHSHTFEKKSATGHRKPPKFPMKRKIKKKILCRVSLYLFLVWKFYSPNLQGCGLPVSFRKISKKVFNEENMGCRLLFL